MMNTTNTASPDFDVAKRIAQITSENTPFMQQARTAGLQQANQRGLANSSMAVGASQAEAYKAAAPIASQEANLNANARDKQLDALTTLSAQRMNAIAQTMANENIPADARNSVLRSYNDQFSQITNYLQNLYGTRLNQTPPTVPTAPPVMGGADAGGPGYTPPGYVPPYYAPPNYGDYGIRGLAF